MKHEAVSHSSKSIVRRSRRPRGFTLVEVLLALTVLGLIAGAVIMNFSNLLDSQHLEEGASRVESLVRMTKAQAALQGKRMRMLCDVSSGTLALEWEPNPASEPGKFVKYEGMALGEASIAEHVKITGCKADGPDAGGDDGKTVITFDPDGSCDGFTIDLSSVNDKDARRAHVQLYAFDGTIATDISIPDPDQETGS